MDDLLPPSAALKPFIEGYWQRRGLYEPAKKVRVLADACTKIIFELVPMPWASSYVIGTQLSPIVVTLAGEVDRIGIRFRLGMAGFFLGQSLDGLSGRLTSFAELPLESEDVADRLKAAPSLADRALILDAWLNSLLAKQEPDAAEIQDISRLSKAVLNGLAPPDLAALMGWSERQLQRVCRERFGASAANLHRFCRFELLQARLKGRPVELANLAAELGFSDQAHMTREFRHFAGTTMTSFLKERAAVGNVQDGGDWLPVLRKAEESGIC
jgi:AraC-like DNA-binding protein